MIHDPKSIIVALCITAVMLLAGWFFVVWGLTMATGALWL
jgi:hypothetical protein